MRVTSLSGPSASLRKVGQGQRSARNCMSYANPPMRSYIITSGFLFALLVVVHALRVVAEGVAVVGNPVFVVSTLASAAMSVWAWFAFKSSKASAQQ